MYTAEITFKGVLYMYVEYLNCYLSIMFSVTVIFIILPNSV